MYRREENICLAILRLDLPPPKRPPRRRKQQSWASQEVQSSSRHRSKRMQAATFSMPEKSQGNRKRTHSPSCRALFPETHRLPRSLRRRGRSAGHRSRIARRRPRSLSEARGERESCGESCRVPPALTPRLHVCNAAPLSVLLERTLLGRKLRRKKVLRRRQNVVWYPTAARSSGVYLGYPLTRGRLSIDRRGNAEQKLYRPTWGLNEN